MQQGIFFEENVENIKRLCVLGNIALRTKSVVSVDASSYVIVEATRFLSRTIEVTCIYVDPLPWGGSWKGGSGNETTG